MTTVLNWGSCSLRWKSYSWRWRWRTTCKFSGNL